MSKKTLSLAAYALLACACAGSTGCVNITRGNSPGIISIPVPVSPYFQKKQEDRFWEDKRYNDVPILGPLTAGGPATGLDEPSDDEIMRAFERARPVQGGLPLLHEIQRNNVRIVKEKIADYIDPPRVVPLIGPVQLHHVHYKCTIYFTEITRVGWPVPYTTRNEDAVEVIYIDHNHFHMVGNPDFGNSGTY
jgi:hypothetical protein